ncbi:hypothetical protein C8J57DRAFT_1515521 [Mycena rebaudengoi]|nr:hypothetical protein C8J57DRAFT_1515521 [Mycena rebaudengoi]
MLSEDDQLLEMEAEAYVVKGMSVPILLGEDFQVTYEIGITRNIETGSSLTFRGSDQVVKATGVDPIVDTKAIHSLTTSLTVHADSVTRIRQHRRNKGAQRRKRLRLGAEGNLIRATEDTKIRPHTCKTIAVSGDFRDEREWLVQKNMLANADDSFFVIPNTLISSGNPVAPVSNLSDQPRYVRRGEILGSIVDPQEYFDSPKTQDKLTEFQKSVKVIQSVIEANGKASSSPATSEAALGGRSRSKQRGGSRRRRPSS